MTALPLRPFSRGPVPAQTAREAEEFDRWAIETAGVPQPVLMENAGRAAASILHQLHPEGLVVGMIGGGNNGGDALVALRHLSAWGREVAAIPAVDRDGFDPLLHGHVIDFLDEGAGHAALQEAAVVVDGILGTGVKGAPREHQAMVIGAVNASPAPVLSLDLPSGVDATTGEVPGAAVWANVTVAFGAPKVGCLVHPGRALTGRHVVVDIGFPPGIERSSSARVATPEWARARLPRRGTDTHKNRVGRVLVVGGQLGMAGAVVLAARGAFRAGAGLVQVASVPENRAAIQAAIPEAIFVDGGDEAGLAEAVTRTDAVVLGPGLGTSEAAGDVLDTVLEAADATPLVVDADALNLLAAAGRWSAGDRRVLLTPHPGEMDRLLGADATPDRLQTARAAAERFGCSVLYKGAPSLVATPDHDLLIDSQSSSDLAVAGMGDVLAGVCGALLAAGVEVTEAGSLGLYLSGRAAHLAGRGAGMTPSDVLRWLPEAGQEPGVPTTDLAGGYVLFDADPAR